MWISLRGVCAKPRAVQLSSSRNPWIAFFRARRRLLVIGGVVAMAIGVGSALQAVDRGEETASVVEALRREGLAVDPASIVWLEPPKSAIGVRGAIVRAAVSDEPADLYYVGLRMGDGGAVLGHQGLSNLTRTSGADEEAPTKEGDFVVYASRVAGRFDAVTVLDARGEPSSLTEGWPVHSRLQNRITNLQETGRFEGFGKVRYALKETAESVSLRVKGGNAYVDADGRAFVLELGRSAPYLGGEHVEVAVLEKGRPGTLTWVVDSVRNLSFVGPEPIAWLEHRVFTITDALRRGYYSVVDTDTAAEVAEDLGVSAEETKRRLKLAVSDPDLGWPPPPIKPTVKTPVEGEGQWLPIVDDPFVRSYPGAPPAFYQTFLQVDPERPFTRVYVILWDPRQVQFRVMTGTREPESATGATGRGMVPRDPATLKHMVAGFNGGFQSLHGEFGMKSEGRVYLPPKPWAATVAVYDDGRVAMGSWLDPPEGVKRFQESWAIKQIPEDMVELRQNLTSVVEGDRYNPWRRWWWGAAPQGDEEQVFIDRSGICLTKEGFFAYFWGKSMGADELGTAMLATRCVRGIHLDMNERHTAFEYYNVQPVSEPRATLGRKLQDFEFDEPVPHVDGWVMRGRKAVRSMTPMRFPRYLLQDPRDFFYLLLKPVLPGPSIEVGGKRHDYSTAGLPHAGWPHAFARTRVGEGSGRTWLVRIAPTRAVVKPIAAENQQGRVLAWLTHAAEAAQGAWGLYATKQTIGHGFGVGAVPKGGTLLLGGADLNDVTQAQAAVGVDQEGFWVYAEQESLDPSALRATLSSAGVEHAVALSDEMRLAFVVDEKTVSPDAYERPVDQSQAMPFYAEERPAAEVLFPDVEPRPYMYWYQMQDTRVRYLKDEDHVPRFLAPDPPP